MRIVNDSSSGGTGTGSGSGSGVRLLTCEPSNYRVATRPAPRRSPLVCAVLVDAYSTRRSVYTSLRCSPFSSVPLTTTQAAQCSAAQCSQCCVHFTHNARGVSRGLSHRKPRGERRGEEESARPLGTVRALALRTRTLDAPLATSTLSTHCVRAPHPSARRGSGPRCCLSCALLYSIYWCCCLYRCRCRRYAASPLTLSSCCLCL